MCAQFSKSARRGITYAQRVNQLVRANRQTLKPSPPAPRARPIALGTELTMTIQTLNEELHKAELQMEKILRTQTRSSKEYMRAVREYQKIVHQIDSECVEVGAH